ncbi:uncharacterized protein LOC110830416 [Zootermopsis nevadensis]|uniref:uncharacterized protein LOC110830416 n=1 Tax=Zootermopsis nevadensis TaxID=136037 RepID=UPI000B8EAF90|nr:uncharacterized protein LOC110830416 [Zootermopsis nevadensis]
MSDGGIGEGKREFDPDQFHEVRTNHSLSTATLGSRFERSRVQSARGRRDVLRTQMDQNEPITMNGFPRWVRQTQPRSFPPSQHSHFSAQTAVDAWRRYTMRLITLVFILQLANCLPIVDPGLFVIMGVRSCRAGVGYCLLGLDCTLDEDFLPDDQGGHCDGLRSAFTPSAHFTCCRYSAVNRTIPHLPYPASVGQDVAENDLAPLGDYAMTDALGSGGDFPSGSNFVQITESSQLDADSSIPFESSIQPSQDLLPADISLETDDNRATTTDISNSPALDTVKYEDILVADFNIEDGTLQSNTYTTEMFSDIHTAAENILRNTETPSSQHSDATANTELKSEEHSTVTEATVTHVAVQTQNQSSSSESGPKISGSIGVGDNETLKSNLKFDQVGSPDDRDRTTSIITGAVEAQPSVVSARTETVIRDDKTRHRNVEIKNHDIATVEAATELIYYGTDTSESHRDTGTESYSAVTVSEMGAEETAPSSLQPVFEDTVVPFTHPDQGLQDSLVVTESESGKASSKLYEDTKPLQEFDQKLFVHTSDYSGYHTNSSSSVLPPEHEDTQMHTVTETVMSGNGNSVTKDDTTNVLSESKSTDNSEALGSAAESSGQHFLPQSSYKDTVGAGTKIELSIFDEIDALSQPSRSVSEISKNILNLSETSNEIPGAIPTKFTELETIRTVSGQTTTSSENDPEYVAHTSLQKGSDTASVISASWKQDLLPSALPETTEGLSVMRKPVNKPASATDSVQKPELSSLHETTLSLTTDQVSSSKTITELVDSLETQQLNEITTELLALSNETTTGADEENLETVSSSSAETTAGHELKSDEQSEKQSTGFLGNDSESPDNSENVTASIPKATVIHGEIAVTSEATEALPVVFDREGTYSTSNTVEASNSFSVVESHSSPVTTGSSVPSDVMPDVATKQPPLCGEKFVENFYDTNCWLVHFVNPYDSNSSVCVGSYVDSNTVVTSATCVSRVFDIGVARVNLLSAGGAVTRHAMVRDIIAHEEYRNKGVKVSPCNSPWSQEVQNCTSFITSALLLMPPC